MAKEKINLLLQHMGVTTVDEKITIQAIQNKLIHDFEDGMEYYSALQSKCDCIVTENQKDFYFGDMEVIGCEELLRKIKFEK